MRVFATLAAASSLLALCSAYEHPREHYEHLFVDWMMTHNMRFESGFEFAHRLGVFADNHDLITAHNVAGNESYSLGHNAYSHLTLDEFHQRFRLGKYRYFQSFTEGRSGQRKSHVGEAGLTLRGSALPDLVDWVEAGAVTAVKDQGMCGSCWAFSTTGALEGAYYLSKKSLVAFSEQELVDCDKVDAACGGGLMDNAFGFIEKRGGLPTESAYPYEGTAGSCNSSVPLVPGSAIKAYTDVAHSDAALTAAIAKQPVSVAIQADQQSFQFYSGGVLSGSCGNKLDHGVLAVGYGTDAASDLEYYKIKNSWGPSWGEKGFIRIQKGKKQSGGQCGILLAASYPSL